MTDAPASPERAPHDSGERGAVGAIDIGSNSTNLLIVDAGGRTLERVETTTRLGQSLRRTGRLSDESIARTLDALPRVPRPARSSRGVPGASGGHGRQPAGEQQRRLLLRRGEVRRCRARACCPAPRKDDSPTSAR